MRNLVLAAAAVAALSIGSAHAQDSAADQPSQSVEHQAQVLAYATTTRGQVSIYSSVRQDSSQGGEQ